MLPLYTVPSLPYINYTLSWYYSSTDFNHYLYHFIFKSARRTQWFPHRPVNLQFYLNPLVNIQSCFDAFPTNAFDTLWVDAATCLSLPIYTIILHSLPVTYPSYNFLPPSHLLARHPGAKKLLAIDVFRYDSESQNLRLRHSPNEFSRYPTVSKHVAALIRDQHLLLQPFFLNNCRISPRPAVAEGTSPSLRPFCLRLLSPPPQDPRPNHSRRRGPALNSIKHFKRITSTVPPTIPPFHHSSPRWHLFWSLPIPLAARTVWYRALHHKIPTRSLLHHRLPDAFPSSLCQICSSNTVEEIDHLLFTCPPKFMVWRELVNTYLIPQPIPDAAILPLLLQLLSCSSDLPSRDGTLPFPEISSHQIFACALLSIWQAHWRLTFDDTPFLPVPVLHRIARSLARLDAEIQYES